MSKWVVNVPAATVWTQPDSAREIDQKAVTNPVQLEGWLNDLDFEARLGLCNENLVQTQLLFGEEVLVTEEKEEWAHVICINQPSSKDSRGYPGWVPKVQLAELETWDAGNRPAAVVQNKKAVLKLETVEIEISYQTVLPVLSEESDRVTVQTPLGEGELQRSDIAIYSSVDSRPKGGGSDIAACGEQFAGLPYLWGGMSSYGYDCSGFTYTMCKANGHIIPRDAHDQLNAGDETDLDQLEPGDLLYFAYEEGKGSVHHVGIYYGGGKLLHSPNTGKSIEIIDMAGTIYEKELCAARRYGRETEE
ncbi:NlpC/P60 family protein [Peribacillus sp. SCS-26]|uniref:C40 family peptidase n=1 Tax=Paraperibacillus marinus TaxID=3115295 RepID=UPI003905C87C